MDVLSNLALIAGVIFIGFLAEIIFKKFSFPDVLILSFVGIGLASFLQISDPAFFGTGADIFSTFALIFILFQGATNINFKTLVRYLPSTLKLTSLSFLLSTLVVFLITFYFSSDLLISLIVGTILGGTSSSVVIPLVSNVEIRNKYSSVFTMESAISDVLCILGTVTVLEIILTGNVSAPEIFQQILSSFSLALLVGAVFGVGWILLFRKYDYLNNFYMLTIAFLLGVYVFVEGPFISASGPIAVLAFGLVLGNSKAIFAIIDGEDKEEDLKSKKKNKKFKKLHLAEENEHLVKNVITSDAKNFYNEVSFFVKTFFFVYLGMLINFDSFEIFLFGFYLILAMLLIRPFAVWLVFKDNNIDVKEKTYLEILIPKGLAAAVLAGIVVQNGAFGNESSLFVNLILSVILSSIVISSILVFLTDRGRFKGVYRIFSKKSKVNN